LGKVVLNKYNFYGGGNGIAQFSFTQIDEPWVLISIPHEKAHNFVVFFFMAEGMG